MAITPTGSPSWVRNSDYTTYGGNVNKANYQGQGKVNARTDVDAEEFARMTADLAAIMRTASMCVLTFTCRDTAVLDPLVTEASMQPSGAVTVSYSGDAPPAGFPTVERIGDGHVRVTFDASYTDPYGVSGAFAPSQAIPGAHGSTGLDVGVVISGATVDVYITSGGAAATDKSATLEVW